MSRHPLQSEGHLEHLNTRKNTHILMDISIRQLSLTSSNRNWKEQRLEIFSIKESRGGKFRTSVEVPEFQQELTFFPYFCSAIISVPHGPRWLQKL